MANVNQHPIGKNESVIGSYVLVDPSSRSKDGKLLNGLERLKVIACRLRLHNLNRVCGFEFCYTSPRSETNANNGISCHEQT